MDSAGLLAVGLFTGWLAGLFGIGGGLVMVPLLCLGFGMSSPQANATSLAAMLLPVGLFGVLAYHRQKLVDLRAAAIMAIALATGSWFGAWLALGVFKTMLFKMFSAFVLLMAIRFMEPWQFWQEKVADAEPEQENPTPRAPAAGLAATGLLAGILSGLFGIGGGIIIVPALSFWAKFPQRRAVATSLAVLLPPVALPAVLEYHAQNQLDLHLVLPLVAGLAAGTFLGAHTGLKVAPAKVRFSYGLFLLLVGGRLAFKAITGA